jgi:hypothetical protein
MRGSTNLQPHRVEHRQKKHQYGTQHAIMETQWKLTS